MRLTVAVRSFQPDMWARSIMEAAQTGAKWGSNAAAQIFVQHAQEMVPVDTGHLRDSIHAELVEATDTRTVVAVTPAYEDPNPYGFEPAYARRIEYGFAGSDSLGRVYHQAAQPYMRPAFDEGKDEAEQVIADSILTAVRVVAGRIANQR